MRRILIPIVLAISAFALATSASAGNFRSHLNGAGQVPPNASRGQGQAIFFTFNGVLAYRLNIANIRDVVAAHIHCAPEGVNGPVGVTLFLGAPVGMSGTLARGPILAPDVGNACGWSDVADVIAALASGDTYVNVHTLPNLAGEIRGQVR